MTTDSKSSVQTTEKIEATINALIFADQDGGGEDH